MSDGRISDDVPRVISRREILRNVGIVGAVAIGARPGLVHATPEAAATEAFQAGPAPAAREALEHLTAAEADTLEAIVSRIIPSDSRGPGAKEARSAHYIDRALGGAIAESRPAYAAGLAALDGLARASHGTAFHELSPTDQDSLLTSLESGAATGFPDGRSFFDMVRTHTIQGTFGDPYYGGNANFIGWDMIGYPGVRTVVTAADQRMSTPPSRIHKSAYDYQMFTKASADADPHGAKNHAD